MFAMLRVTGGPEKGKLFTLEEGKTLVLGQAEGTPGCLRDPRLGPAHCRLEYAAGKIVLTDGGGAGGTQVNGEAVTRRELRTGDVLKLGDTKILFSLVDP